MNLLTLRGVSAGYGDGDVLRGIDLDVTGGTFLCIIGPNGCGKTTLLRAMAGLLPSRGEILLHQRPIQRMTRRALASEIALLSQRSSIYFAYSVYDTVMLGRYPHQRGAWAAPSDEDRAAVRQALDTVGLWDARARAIDVLSGGQLQRVFLARTLAQNPKIILLDEPTNHLDLRYQIALMDALRTWSRTQDRAVVGVLHDLNLALTYADAMLLLAEGQNMAAGSPEAVLRPGLLRDVFGMDVAGYMKKALSRWESINVEKG